MLTVAYMLTAIHLCNSDYSTIVKAIWALQLRYNTQ